MGVDNNPIQNHHSNSLCLQKIMESIWSDVALVVGGVALLVIGILASSGVFNFMGTTQAAHLSYGMYAGAALLMLSAVVKYAHSRCKTGELQPPTRFTLDPAKSIDEQVKKFAFGPRWTLFGPTQAYCTITFANDYTTTRDIDGGDLSLLWDAASMCSNGKFYTGNALDRARIDYIDYMATPRQGRTEFQVLDEFAKG